MTPNFSTVVSVTRPPAAVSAVQPVYHLSSLLSGSETHSEVRVQLCFQIIVFSVSSRLSIQSQRTVNGSTEKTDLTGILTHTD